MAARRSGSPDPRGEGRCPCSPKAHLTHILLKRNRSSHVKARSVVITPPPPKPSPLKPYCQNLTPAPPEVRQRTAADAGRRTASGPPVSSNHAATQLPLVARVRNCQVTGSALRTSKLLHRSDRKWALRSSRKETQRYWG